MITSSL